MIREDECIGKDKETYRLTSLYLYLSHQCNLACSHCWISPEHASRSRDCVPVDDLRSAVLQAKPLGLCNVKLTGGEPLLYPELPELVTFLGREDLRIDIETNGVLVDDSTVDLFQAAGVRQVSVSLDSASETVHDRIRGVPGSFRKTVRAVRLLTAAGMNVQIIMTLQDANRADIPDTVALTGELGARSLKINPLVPCGRGQSAFEQKRNLTLDDLMEIQRTTVPPSNGKLRVLFDLPAVFQPLAKLMDDGIDRCHVLNILGILANGDVSICGIGQSIEALRMGNVRADSIEEIWTNHPLLLDMRSSMAQRLKGACSRCIFKFDCLGACRASAYFLTGDMYAPYYLCEELMAAGAFPESRTYSTVS